MNYEERPRIEGPALGEVHAVDHQWIVGIRREPGGPFVLVVELNGELAMGDIPSQGGIGVDAQIEMSREDVQDLRDALDKALANAG